MNDRYDPSHPQSLRHHAARQIIPLEPRNHPLTSKPSVVLNDEVNISPDTNSVSTEELADIRLEDEVSEAELDQFAMLCLELIHQATKAQPAEQMVRKAIHQRLPIFATLTQEHQTALHEHRQHHLWTEQLVDSVKPLLQSQSAPREPQNELSNLAIQCVEQNLQLKYKVDQLALRIELLRRAIPEHLAGFGKHIGLPDTLMQQLAGLVESILRR